MKKRVLCVLITVIMLISMLPLPPAIAAEGDENPLTTIWREANVGSNTGGSYTYTKNSGLITITGAGTIFDKDYGVDDYYYAYFDVHSGTTTVIAKMNPVLGATSGFSGIAFRNGLEPDDMAAAIYYDYTKGELRLGRHGGASTLLKISAITTDIYIKLEISEATVYRTVASDKDFTDIIVAKNAIGATGLNIANIGFFATAGITAEFSDVVIKSEYTKDAKSYKKVVFDSALGELALTKVDPLVTDGNNGEFSSSAAGSTMILDSKSKKGPTNNPGMQNHTYYLFPKTNENYTIAADITATQLVTASEHMGFFMGAFHLDTENKISYFAAYNFHKNYTLRAYVSTGAGMWDRSKCATPKTTLGTLYQISVGRTDTGVLFTAADAESNNLIASDADGGFLGFKDNETATSAILADALKGEVQYGFALCGATMEIKNLKLINADGYIVYDQNDYYKTSDNAPVVDSVSAEVNDDRTAINLSWTLADEGTGQASYVIMVSVDGGNYSLAGTSQEQAYEFLPTASGTYQFKVYGKSGTADSAENAAESAAVQFTQPLPTPELDLLNKSDHIIVEIEDVESFNGYYAEIFRAETSDGEFGSVAIVDLASASGIFDTNVNTEVPYYYYAVLLENKDRTGNSSHPSQTVQGMATSGHSGEFIYEDEAAEITIVEKENDTALSPEGSLKFKVDKNGSAKLSINGQETAPAAVTANQELEFRYELKPGRNDVNLYFTDENSNITRKTFNFVYLDQRNYGYNIMVDSAFAGTNGEEVDGVPTYVSIAAALASIPANNSAEQVIFIKNGSYNERLVIESPYISLIGEDRELTRIYKSVAVADSSATNIWDRNCVYVGIGAAGFSAENLTIENSFPYANGSNEQADALAVVADEALFINIKLLSYQNTLLVDSRVREASGDYKQTRQYFYKCYITGNVDFIYGAATAFFDDCDIVARYTDKKSDGCFSAARTYDYFAAGIIFNNSRFLKESGVQAGAYRLARPWGADASTIFLNCYMGDVISLDTPFSDMSGNSYKDARFAEYYTYGPAFLIMADNRPLLSAAQAANYSAESVFGNFDYAADAAAMYLYTPNTYTIYFHSDGGSMPNDATELEYTPGTGLAQLPTPSKSGYSFAGWYLADENGEIITDTNGNATKVEEISATASGDIYLVAKWNTNNNNNNSGSSTPPAADSEIKVEIVDVSGGDVTITTPDAKPGEDVVIKAESDTDKKVVDVIITDKNGDAVDFINNGDGTFTALAPATDIIVEVVFGGEDEPVSPNVTGVKESLIVDEHIAFLQGYADGAIHPEATISRAEVAQMFYNLLLEKEHSYDVELSDVSADSWYARAVSTLSGLGIISGYEDGSFRPNQSISRAEFVTIAVRFAIVTNGDARFTDVSDEHWAYNYIMTAAGFGWINGYADSTFRPDNSISRAEAAVIVNHMLYRSPDRDFINQNSAQLRSFDDLNQANEWYYYDMVEAANAHEYERAEGVEEIWTAVK